VIRFKISKANPADHITDDISHGILIEITKKIFKFHLLILLMYAAPHSPLVFILIDGSTEN